MSFCTVNRLFIKFKNHKNCQLYKISIKFVKSFKKLGLGTPPLKKREKKIVSFVTGINGLRSLRQVVGLPVKAVL